MVSKQQLLLCEYSLLILCSISLVRSSVFSFFYLCWVPCDCFSAFEESKFVDCRFFFFFNKDILGLWFFFNTALATFYKFWCIKNSVFFPSWHLLQCRVTRILLFSSFIIEQPQTVFYNSYVINSSRVKKLLPVT